MSKILETLKESIERNMKGTESYKEFKLDNSKVELEIDKLKSALDKIKNLDYYTRVKYTGKSSSGGGIRKNLKEAIEDNIRTLFLDDYLFHNSERSEIFDTIEELDLTYVPEDRFLSKIYRLDAYKERDKIYEYPVTEDNYNNLQSLLMLFSISNNHVIIKGKDSNATIEDEDISILLKYPEMFYNEAFINKLNDPNESLYPSSTLKDITMPFVHSQYPMYTIPGSHNMFYRKLLLTRGSNFINQWNYFENNSNNFRNINKSRKSIVNEFDHLDKKIIMLMDTLIYGEKELYHDFLISNKGNKIGILTNTILHSIKMEERDLTKKDLLMLYFMIMYKISHDNGNNDLDIISDTKLLKRNTFLFSIPYAVDDISKLHDLDQPAVPQFSLDIMDFIKFNDTLVTNPTMLNFNIAKGDIMFNLLENKIKLDKKVYELNVYGNNSIIDSRRGFKDIRPVEKVFRDVFKDTVYDMEKDIKSSSEIKEMMFKLSSSYTVQEAIEVIDEVSFLKKYKGEQRNLLYQYLIPNKVRMNVNEDGRVKNIIASLYDTGVDENYNMMSQHYKRNSSFINNFRVYIEECGEDIDKIEELVELFRTIVVIMSIAERLEKPRDYNDIRSMNYGSLFNFISNSSEVILENKENKHSSYYMISPKDDHSYLVKLIYVLLSISPVIKSNYDIDNLNLGEEDKNKIQDGMEKDSNFVMNTIEGFLGSVKVNSYSISSLCMLDDLVDRFIKPDYFYKEDDNKLDLSEHGEIGKKVEKIFKRNNMADLLSMPLLS